MQYCFPSQRRGTNVTEKQKVEEVVVRREQDTMYSFSILFLEQDLSTQYTRSLFNTDQLLTQVWQAGAISH